MYARLIQIENEAESILTDLEKIEADIETLTIRNDVLCDLYNMTLNTATRASIKADCQLLETNFYFLVELSEGLLSDLDALDAEYDALLWVESLAVPA